jgi:hypothetical protein
MRIRAAVAVLMLVLLAGCSGDGAADVDQSGGGQVSARGDAAEEAPAEPAPAEGGVALGGADDSGGDASSDTAADQPVPKLPDTPPLTTGERIIKEGTISIEVEAGEFDVAFRAAIDAAARFGGDVAASSTQTDDDGNTSGSVTVRVPVEDFEDLVLDVGEIGTVVKRDVGSTDVTAEFTDLESRLRHLQAQERFYLGLLNRAKDVQDAIAVQQQVEGIQGEIEKIQGRLNVLDDRTTFSTLTVALFEPGLGATLTEEDPEARPTLARYWDTARDAFVNVVGALLVATLFLAPVLTVLAVGLLLWLVLRRRPRRELPPPAVAERQDDEPPVPVA